MYTFVFVVFIVTAAPLVLILFNIWCETTTRWINLIWNFKIYIVKLIETAVKNDPEYFQKSWIIAQFEWEVFSCHRFKFQFFWNFIIFEFLTIVSTIRGIQLFIWSAYHTLAIQTCMCSDDRSLVFPVSVSYHTCAISMLLAIVKGIPKKPNYR